jgi:hypothetical protein
MKTDTMTITSFFMKIPGATSDFKPVETDSVSPKPQFRLFVVS